MHKYCFRALQSLGLEGFSERTRVYALQFRAKQPLPPFLRLVSVVPVLLDLI